MRVNTIHVMKKGVLTRNDISRSMQRQIRNTKYENTHSDPILTFLLFFSRHAQDDEEEEDDE